MCRVAADRGGGPTAAAGPAHCLLLPGLLLRGVEIGLLSASTCPLLDVGAVKTFSSRSASCWSGKEVLRSVAAAVVHG